MATRAPRLDDHPDDRDEQKKPVAVVQQPKSAQPPTPRNLEKELAEVRAGIDEEWEKMEPSLRYLADR